MPLPSAVTTVTLRNIPVDSMCYSCGKLIPRGSNAVHTPTKGIAHVDCSALDDILDKLQAERVLPIKVEQGSIGIESIHGVKNTDSFHLYADCREKHPHAEVTCTSSDGVTQETMIGVWPEANTLRASADGSAYVAIPKGPPTVITIKGNYEVAVSVSGYLISIVGVTRVDPSVFVEFPFETAVAEPLGVKP